jgi:hypothetical protein
MTPESLPQLFARTRFVLRGGLGVVDITNNR